jgi:hypothetical protein
MSASGTRRHRYRPRSACSDRLGPHPPWTAALVAKQGAPPLGLAATRRIRLQDHHPQQQRSGGGLEVPSPVALLPARGRGAWHGRWQRAAARLANGATWRQQHPAGWMPAEWDAVPRGQDALHPAAGQRLPAAHLRPAPPPGEQGWAGRRGCAAHASPLGTGTSGGRIRRLRRPACSRIWSACSQGIAPERGPCLGASQGVCRRAVAWPAAGGGRRRAGALSRFSRWPAPRCLHALPCRQLPLRLPCRQRLDLSPLFACRHHLAACCRSLARRWSCHVGLPTLRPLALRYLTFSQTAARCGACHGFEALALRMACGLCRRLRCPARPFCRVRGGMLPVQQFGPLQPAS